MRNPFQRHRPILAVSMFVVLVVVAPLWFGTAGKTLTVAQANSAPTNPAQAYYVDETWSDPIHYNGIDTTYAYQLGYAASIGQPTANSVITVDFGRQFDDPSKGWGICLTHYDSPCGKHYHKDSWVASVANDFMTGYNAGHTSTSVIAIGTSNDDNYKLPGGGTDPGWACTEGGTVGSNWQSAGNDWGTQIKSIRRSSPATVVVASANDIEDWSVSGDPWSACGDGIENWFTGYSGVTTIDDYDFGNEPYPKNSPQWMQRQVYDVSYGNSEAVPLPEIYCVAGVDDWKDLSNLFVMFFEGVTSSNGSAGCDGGTTYTWSVAWTTFDTALRLTPTPQSNGVASDSTAFNMMTPTELPTSTPTP
jgi:hypothetical protein